MSNDLFTPLKIKNMTVNGRLFRSAASENGNTPEGVMCDELRELFVDMSKGATPLVMTGFAYVRADGRSEPKQNALHLESLIDQWKKTTDAFHATGTDSKIAVQLVHGGRQCDPGVLPDTFAPSAVEDTVGGGNPRAMTEAEIVDVIEAFVQAGRRAKEAGFDAIQLHTGHGYLLSQFLSPHTNRRTDAWGGSTEKRTRIVREILSGIRSITNDTMPILVKTNATDLLENGLLPEESAEVCKLLIKDGIDAIELSAWMFEAGWEVGPSRDTDPTPDTEGYFLDACLTIRKSIPAGVPLGMCGGWRSTEAMNKAIQEQGFDFLTAARPFIAEPDGYSLLKKGQPRLTCNSCNECLDDGKMVPVQFCPPKREGRLQKQKYYTFNEIEI